ncbi:MAG: OmpA family protein [Bacteroidales bacterium]
MKICTVLVILLSGLFFFSDGYGQSRRLEKAEKAYAAGEYYEAIDLYKDAYSAVSDRDLRTEIVFLIARCYRKVSDTRQTEGWFRRAVNRNYDNPEVYWYYGEALKMNEKYEEAIEQFKIYQDLVPSDPRGETGVKSSELAMQWIDNPTPYEIQEMNFFNSRESDYSPAFANEDYTLVYFTSARKGAANNRHGVTGEYFANIYESRQDRQGRWSDPSSLDGINSEFDEGAPSLNSDYTVMYFTSCKAARRRDNGCQIYQTTRSGNNWGRPEVIDLAPDTLVVAHPAISPDGLTLYFVSDMPGGTGDKDIWKVTRSSKDESWGAPVNMGQEINTTGNEVFPYVHHDGTLYFSSDGHPGMGGLDIFRAAETEEGGWYVHNMGYPVNSSADDFGIVFEKEVERGYLSSNRNRRNIDNIYSFYLPPLFFNVDGTVRDIDTDNVLPGSTVKMVGSDGNILEVSTGDEGQFRFMLRPNVDYIFLASKEGYLTDKTGITTRGLERSKDFSITIDIQSFAKPIELPNIFYDFARWDLRPESLIALDRLVETLNDNPHVTIELASHTDSRGGAAFNTELSQKRAQSVVDYLIENGISADRLVAAGYGKSRPRVIDEHMAEVYPFLPDGTRLTEEFIETLPTEEQRETAHQINRRTEFEVLTTDYQ